MPSSASARRPTKPKAKPMARVARRRATPARQVSLADARNHLTTLVRDVERGLRIELMRRGRPVAVLLSREEFERMAPSPRSIIEILDAWQANADFEGWSEDEVATWRDRSPGRPPPRFGS